MISIIKVWTRVMELAKVGTAGYDDQDAFNDKIYQVQLELAELLSDVYEINKKAADALAPLIIEIPTTTDADGYFELEDDYLHLCTIQLPVITGSNTVNWPMRKINTNEIAMIETSPVRKPLLVNNEAVYYRSDNIVKVIPRQGMDLNTIYCSKPPEATIVLTEASDADSDYLTPSLGDDLVWPESMFNMIVYLTLEKLGIEMKEELLSQFSALGISREMIKTEAQ